MADVAARKRGRSPSPGYGDTLASPLEVLLKRRRRDPHTASRMPPPPVWGAPSLSSHTDEDDSPSSHGPSSPLRRGEEYFERRRQRQWERLQAPSQSQPLPSHPSSSPFRNQPLQRSRTNESTGSASDYEMEVARRQTLSSSPVMHQPPGSTPFRASQWTPEERNREWGEEYARPNSLLHSLHLARAESHPAPIQTPERMDMGTPHRTPGLTPGAPSSTAVPTPYRMRGVQETPGLAASSPWASSPQFSPYAPHAPAPSPVFYEPVVAAQYEEANRLLAELNVARMRRQHDEGE
ncbi:hypothetical protein CC85DRAFT_287278 [Cutaneotrichosporon oleaginosum]|uniref:Uncharacterized protein n=1 Tax=Cutaneotrichosporon oleaginosum TaxID=879819 RepID=A0A0J1AZ97_9TREE|nr:uncharacterized protein CC85DRAFT_287278 [Cutaneotrichosporon oleaginosum]KLT40664.1 hypothetical protein CC85DRAFT_287278 [Cutaneotrichosporon oleaginosum]TXT12474.1 hypothetical protein COLE_02884 [Cutaneotrichosporon oleaginosum]